MLDHNRFFTLSLVVFGAVIFFYGLEPRVCNPLPNSGNAKVTEDELRAQWNAYYAAEQAEIQQQKDELNRKKEQVEKAEERISAQEAMVVQAIGEVVSLVTTLVPAAAPFAPLVTIATGLLTTGLVGDNIRKRGLAQSGDRGGDRSGIIMIVKRYIFWLMIVVVAMILVACTTDDPFRPGHQATSQVIEDEWEDYQAGANVKIGATTMETMKMSVQVNGAIADLESRKSTIEQLVSALSGTTMPTSGGASSGGSTSSLPFAEVIISMLVGTVGVGTHLDNQRKDRAIAVAKGVHKRKRKTVTPPSPPTPTLTPTPTPPTNQPHRPTDSEISLLAYYISLSNPQRSAQDNWLDAQKQLNQQFGGEKG